MIELLFYIYMIFGLLYGIYDWNKNQKDAYKEAEDSGNLETNMVSIYWIFIILFWPIDLFIKFIRKYLI